MLHIVAMLFQDISRGVLWACQIGLGLPHGGQATKVEQHVQRNCKLFAKAKTRHWKGKSEDGRKSSPCLHSKFAGCALEPCRRRDCIALGQALTRTMISENFAGKRSVSDNETAEICSIS